MFSASAGGAFLESVGRFIGLLHDDKLKTIASVPVTLAQAGAPAASVTGTTVETTLATQIIPGGALGLNGSLRMRVLLATTSNANVKTLNIRINGTLVSFVSAGAASVFVFAHLQARNSHTAQALTFFYAGSTNTPGVFALDLSQDSVLTITATLANAADTATLDQVHLEICYGA